MSRTPAEKLRIEIWRRKLREAVGRCEACGCNPRRPRKEGRHVSVLTVHEIGRGTGWRKLCEDKPYATLVLCQFCNCVEFVNKAKWPHERQLALLLASRKEAYNRVAFVQLLRPNAHHWITDADVAVYEDEMRELVAKLKSERGV